MTVVSPIAPKGWILRIPYELGQEININHPGLNFDGTLKTYTSEKIKFEIDDYPSKTGILKCKIWRVPKPNE